MHRRFFVATATCVLWISATATASTRIINGTPAAAGEWPASVVAKIGDASCSATVVGPRTVLLAAHCIDARVPMTFSIGANEYTSLCQRHPSYPQQDVDVALCRVDRDVTDVTFENVLVDAGRVTISQSLSLTGYGCTEPGTGFGGNDGVFRVGQSTVQRLPSGNSVDIVTEGNVALCFGDSGGAAYLVEEGRRVIVGVNSKGNITTTSYLAATFDPTVAAFFKSWSAENAQKICGVHGDAVRCRNAGPSPVFRVRTAVASAEVRVMPAFLEAIDRLRVAVEAALAPCK